MVEQSTPYLHHRPAVFHQPERALQENHRSGGVSRRRVIIHFPEQIAPKERDPITARALLQSQQNSDEALSVKHDADFCGYLEMLSQTNGMFMDNARFIPRNYCKYLYHAYLAYMEANGYRNELSLKIFLGLPMMLKEESYGDWLPKCDDPATT